MSTQATNPEIVENSYPPEYDRPLAWYQAGFYRQDFAIIGALVAVWTGLPFALWLAAAGFGVGAVIGFIGSTAHSSSLGVFGTIVGSPGGGLLGALLGAVLGTVGGFALIYYYFITHPRELVGGLIAGAIVSAMVFVLMDSIEPHLMQLRGYRRPSRRERTKISPLLYDTAAHMSLAKVPDCWINESHKPGAWMHLRAMVLSRGLLGDYDASENPPTPELDDAALSSIMAHELNHWQKGDVVGLTMITACFFPFVCIVNGIQWIRIRSEWFGVVLWIFLWPIWISSRFLVTPLMAQASRRQEFEADARAASLGDQYRLGLRRALTQLAMWERPRTGWEDIVAATHPPIEARLEALERGVVDIPTLSQPEATKTRPRSPTPIPAVVAKPAKSKRKSAPRRKPAPTVPEPEPEPVVEPTSEKTDDGQWSV